MTPSLVRVLVRDRSFTVKVWMALITGLAILSWLSIPKEVLPRESVPEFLYVGIEATEPSSVEQMETLLGLPLEGLVKTLPGLRKYNTSVTARGVSLSLTFRPRTSIDEVSFQLTEGLQSMADLGLLDMRKVSINQLNPEAVAVMKLSMRPQHIRNPVKVIGEDLRGLIEAIPQVSKVEVIGLEPRVLQINVRPKELQALGVSPAQLLAKVRTEAVRESVGDLLIDGSDISLSVLLRSEKMALPELLNKSISPSSMKLGLLAPIEVRSKQHHEVYHDSGEFAVFLEVFHREGANLFELNNEISQLIAKLPERSDDLSQLHIHPIFDRTEDLKNGISEVFSALGQAMVISFLVVLLFLRHFGLTLLVCLSIPLSLLLTVMIMHFQGSSLNLLSLSGLILSVGMVVDNAVIVIENIQKKRAQYQSFLHAAAEGAAEMAPALLMSTLSTITIFIPAAFVEGGDSFTDILKAFQLPMIAALISGYVISLLFVPIAASWITIKPEYERSMSQFQDRVFRMSSPLFRFAYDQRWLCLTFGILASLAGLNWIKGVELVDLDPPRDPFVQIQVNYGAEVATLERRVAYLALEKKFLAAREELGFRVLLSEFNPQGNYGQFSFYPKQRIPQDEDLDALQLRVRDYARTFTLAVGERLDLGDGFAGQLSLPRQTFRFSGPRISRMLELQTELGRQIEKIENVSRVKTELEDRGQRALVFVPNTTSLRRSGLDLAGVTSQLASRSSSVTVTGLNLNGEPAVLRVAVRDDEKQGLDSILGFRLKNPDGNEILLGDLGEFRTDYFLQQGSRRQGISHTQMTVQFASGLTSKELNQARAQVSQLVQSYDYPTGYGLQDASGVDFTELNQKSQFLIGFAVFLIFLFLGALYESFLAPIAILFTVPVSLIFGVCGLRALGMPLDVMGRFSLLILTGVAINASIILVDVIRQFQREGLSLRLAIQRGCAERLMAVLMSTAVQVLGVLPIALGNAKIMGIPYSSLGVTIISGVLFSTLMTLIVLPAVYSILDSFEKSLSRSTQSSSSHTLAAEGSGSKAA